MVDKVENYIKKNNLISEGDAVCAALSGGADSVALLVVLRELSGRIGFSLSAVHVNHNLRGEESNRDERFCVELCGKLNVSITVKSVDVAAWRAEHSDSVELAARKLRYRAFGEISADKIATAHNANDNLETAIFNLTRGTGLKGACGIAPKRDKFVRPLLGVTRAEIEEFLTERGQDWVTDSTNSVDDCSRNLIRHRVLPELLKINPRALESFARAAELMSADEKYLSKIAAAAFLKLKRDGGYDADGLISLDRALRGRVLTEILSENSVEVSEKKVGDLERVFFSGGEVNLADGVFAKKSRGLVFVGNTHEKPCFSAELTIGEEREVFGKKISIKKADNVHNPFTNYVLDCDKIKGRIILRTRKSGDRIKLLGRDFTSDVRKLLSRLPEGVRDKAILLCDDDGVIFVEGSGAADRVRVDDNTRIPLRVIISS